MNYSEKLNRLYKRQNPFSTSSYSQIFSSANESVKDELDEARKYANCAMAELPKRSTEISYEEGDRIKAHLEEELPIYGFKPMFRYQGSVPCRTHIKYHSDIDLLVIIDKFETCENPGRVTNPYSGNPIEDLQKLRAACIKILKENYTVADVEKHAKSIKISGGSLRRQIDVVPSNWYNTEKWYQYKEEYFRGIQILNNKDNQRIKNYPFLNVHLIDEKDNQTEFLYRPLVRLAKTLKEDADVTINISSYDIQALFYNMDDSLYSNSLNVLLYNASKYLFDLKNDVRAYNSLVVPDETRKISDNVTVSEVGKLFNEFYDLYKKVSEQP